MKILAVDTSSKICSVSILEDDRVILEKHTNDEKTHSQKLMPLIDEIFKETKLTLDDINLLACSQGPRVIYRNQNWISHNKSIFRQQKYSCSWSYISRKFSL